MMSGPWTSSDWKAWRRASTRRHPFGDQPARLVFVLLAPGFRPDLVDHVAQLRERIPRLVHRLAHPLPLGSHQVPARGGLHQPVHAAHQLALQFRIDLAVERLDVGPPFDRARHVPRDPERPHHVGRAGARLGHHPRDERDPLRVHDVVRGDRRDRARASADGPRSGGRIAPRPPAGSSDCRSWNR